MINNNNNILQYYNKQIHAIKLHINNYMITKFIAIIVTYLLDKGFNYISDSNYCPLSGRCVYKQRNKMSLKIYANDSEEESEEEDDIKRNLVANPSPIPGEQSTEHYATMADIEREGDIVNEGGVNLALYEVR